MRADYLSYKRATHRSLIGLAIQLALGLALLLYGILGRDHAAKSASIYVLTGVPAWLILAVLFDQHRRERIESIEAEAFASSDAASSSVFESQESDLKVAAKRLKTMYRILVPAASLALGALLVGLGVWRFNSGREMLASFQVSRIQGWSMAVGLASAFVGFLFARYISGMAKEKVWHNLRAGAGFAVGSALLGLTLALANFVAMVGGPSGIAQYLMVAFPAALIVLGVEIFLNFVLDIYRPRKPGEYPRPAFESRILGFVAAPDRIAESIGEAINYQFGYDVSSGWFYRLLSRSVVRILLPVALVVLLAMSSMAVIRPHEQGMVLRFGKFERMIGPGLHVKWPWPVERVEVPQYTRRDTKGKVIFSSPTVTGVRTLDIGAVPPPADRPILWTNEHAVEETFFLVQPDTDQRSTQSSGGLAMLAMEVPLHYAVDDVKAYETLASPEHRDELLRSVAQRAVMQYISTVSVGELLSGRRAAIQEEVRKRVEDAFVKINPEQNGKPVVKVLFVGLQGVHPPSKNDTAKSFEQVVGAEQKYLARLRDAEGTAIKTLTMAAGSVELANQIVHELDTLESIPSSKDGQPNPEHTEQQLKIRGLIQKAGGKAASMILGASADRWQRHMGERARLFAYEGQLGTYRANPSLYRASLYLDALKSAMADARVIINDTRAGLNIRTNFEDRDSVTDILNQQPAE